MSARLTRVVAVLTGAPGRPQGNTSCVLELRVPLTADSQLDALAFQQLELYCDARLVEGEVPVWTSPVLLNEMGWSVRPEGTEESPLWRIDSRMIRPGEYLTLFPPDDREQSFRIVNVDSA